MTAMQGFEVKFNVYANSQAEADELTRAVKDFISDHARHGVAVTATKLTSAIRRFGESPITRNRITNYFKD